MKLSLYLLSLTLCLSAPLATTAGTDDQDNANAQHPRKGEKLRKQLQDFQEDLQRGEVLKQIIKDLPPTEIDRLKKMRADNPDEFHNEIRKLLKSKALTTPPGDRREDTQQVRKVVKEFKECQDPAKKEQLKTRIKDEVTKVFEKRMADNKERLERAEQKLSELKGLYEKRRANASQIIEERIRNLTTDNESTPKPEGERPVSPVNK